LPTRSPMARVRKEIDTFTIPEGCRQRVYQPWPIFGARPNVVSTEKDATTAQLARGRIDRFGSLSAECRATGKWQPSAHPYRSRSLPRVSANRADTGQAAGTRQSAPHLPFAIPIGNGSVGWVADLPQPRGERPSALRRTWKRDVGLARVLLISVGGPCCPA